nr:uncharacterized protein LOC123568442 isoform X3 [Macaca fascicularis]
MWPGDYLPTPAPENKTYVCVNIYTQVFLPRRNHQVLEATQASFNGGVSDVGENELETDTGMEVWMALGRPLAAGGRQEQRGRQEQHGMRERQPSEWSCVACWGWCPTSGEEQVWWKPELSFFPCRPWQYSLRYPSFLEEPHAMPLVAAFHRGPQTLLRALSCWMLLPWRRWLGPILKAICQNLQESFCVLDLRQPLQEKNHSPEDVHVPIAGASTGAEFCQQPTQAGNRHAQGL